MTYSELIEAFFERTVALQWYWTIYIIVIGGILAFSTLRQRPELVTTVLVSALFISFAFKNLDVIEITQQERQAILSALQDIPATGEDADNINRVRERLEPVLPLEQPSGTRYFHIFCDLLTLAAIWAKEWQRRKWTSES